MDYSELASRYGLQGVFLAALFYAARWLAQEILRPLKDKHLVFLDAHVKWMQGQQSLLEKMQEAQVETNAILTRLPDLVAQRSVPDMRRHRGAGA